MKIYRPDELKFLLALRAIATGIRWGRIFDPEIREMAKENDLIVQIKAEDRGVGRYFILKNGRFKTKRGIHPDPEFSWVFSDSRAGFDTIRQGKEEAMAQAMADGKVKFEGDFNRGLWFNNLVKKSGEFLKRPQKLFKSKAEQEEA